MTFISNKNYKQTVKSREGIIRCLNKTLIHTKYNLNCSSECIQEVKLCGVQAWKKQGLFVVDNPHGYEVQNA